MSKETIILSARWALERAEFILAKMADERPGLWTSVLGLRWPINHEPLRNDARNALPEIQRAIERLRTVSSTHRTSEGGQ